MSIMQHGMPMFMCVAIHRSPIAALQELHMSIQHYHFE